MSRTQTLSRAPAAAAKPHPGPLALADILTYQDERAAAATALRYAQGLAEAGKGQVTGHVIGLMLAYMPPTTAMGYSELGTGAWEELRRSALEDAAGLWTSLKRRIDGLGGQAELRRADVFADEAGDLFARHARYADLAVLGWPNGGDRDRETTLLEGALFQSGRPVLVVPEAWTSFTPPREIVIAWNGSREAARAVNDAMPLLRHAGGAMLVTVDGAGQESEDPGAAIAAHLSRHGLAITVKQVPALGRDSHEAVLDEARFAGADLIVSGGYGHTRLREWVFGGFTRGILDRSGVPLLLSH